MTESECLNSENSSNAHFSVNFLQFEMSVNFSDIFCFENFKKTNSWVDQVLKEFQDKINNNILPALAEQRQTIIAMSRKDS